jgi:transcriptional regulator with XRE-family HTH domain
MMSSPTVDSIRKNLRIVRKIKGLTLQEVGILSDGKWKPVVVGSWERGDRAISIKNLIGLAEFYEVSLETLLYGVPDPKWFEGKLVLNEKSEVVWSATEALVGETNRAT